jgi:hypothetical protein
MISGFADRRLWPLGYARVIVRKFADAETRSESSQNPKFKTKVRTAGLEPAKVSLKD